MPKPRVHELAKELNVSSKELISKLGTYGKTVTNHMSSLDESDVSRLKKDFTKPATPKAPKKAAKPPTSPSVDVQSTEKPPKPVASKGEPPRQSPKVDADGKPLQPRPRLILIICFFKFL